MNISQSIISNEGMKLFMEVIRFNTFLLAYDISHNNLCDDGAIAISRCLKHNRVIKVLNIAGNNITMQGAKIVANFIQETSYHKYYRKCSTMHY